MLIYIKAVILFIFLIFLILFICTSINRGFYGGSNYINVGVFTYNTVWNGIKDKSSDTRLLNGTQCMEEGINLCQNEMINTIHKYFNNNKVHTIYI